ncbi:hypothetical protein QE439_002085 [Pedobacter agri]|nr:hypothetical protein [Pedobacter agri]
MVHYYLTKDGEKKEALYYLEIIADALYAAVKVDWKYIIGNIIMNLFQKSLKHHGNIQIIF